MSDTVDTIAPKRDEMFGHPKGLFVLFFTEMWERFSYYGMRAILVLYIISETTGDNPGLGWTKVEALALYGWYTMMVYVMSIPGGILADKFLGQKKTVFLGGILLCAGHGILAVEEMWAFYTGLVLIVLGVGGLKPNISTMVGGLYPQGDVRRDKGFTIFYIGINIGAFLSSLIVGAIGEIYGWHYGFGIAGIGMVLGQVVYAMGQKHLEGIGDLVKSNADGTNNTDVPLTKIEKDRIVVMLLSFIIIVVFWGAFEQAGGLMNIYTMEKIDRNLFGMEIPASVFQSVNAFFIIVFGTTIAGLWARRQVKGKESSTLFKMATGTMIMGLGFLFMSGAALEADSADSGKAAMIWLIAAYLLHTIGELFASPNALSFVTKLAPAKYASIMMGCYFAATGFGSKLAGLIGESVESASELEIFTGIFIFTTAFGVLLLIFLKKLKALTHGAEDIQDANNEETEGFKLADKEA
ncbi:MAG: peptide MFS transporter [Flavobacteriales bacterium]|nr:peptide MFS transporter [Flavobacteriales bacterium]